MPDTQTPFDSIEGAHQYVQLLCEAIDDAQRDIAAQDRGGGSEVAERRHNALRLVTYKLDQLRTHMQASSRILNDLRTLRRLLLNERAEPT